MAERKKGIIDLPQEYLDKELPEFDEHSNTDEARTRQEIASWLIGGPGMVPAKLGGKLLTKLFIKAAPKYTKAYARAAIKTTGSAGSLGGLTSLSDLADLDKSEEVDDRPTVSQRIRATLEDGLPLPPLPKQYAETKKTGGKVSKSKPVGVGIAKRGYGAVRKK
jgi:hypothetical protein